MNRESLSYRMLLLIGFCGFAFLFLVGWGLQQSMKPQEQQRVAAQIGTSPFSGDRAYNDLKEIVALGPRVSGTDASAETRSMIRKALKQAGLEVREFEFEAQTPLGKKSMTNVVGVVKGTTDSIVILSNHYDTKYFPDFHFVGANDGGSTTAWMIEMARALGGKRQGHEVWLVFHDGEEAFKEWTDTDSLYGSREMAKKLQSDGTASRVLALINVDMIGDCYLGIFKDPGAPAWLIDTVWTQAASFGYSKHFLDVPMDVTDDHVPFRKVGIPAINLIDMRYGGSSLDHRRNWHTVEDTIEKVCPESLQAVGDVLYNVILQLDRRHDARHSSPSEESVLDPVPGPARFFASLRMTLRERVPKPPIPKGGPWR